MQAKDAKTCGDIAARIREVTAGSTLAELAAILGASEKSAWNWRHGHRTPPAAILRRMAMHYGVSVDYLLGLQVAAGSDNPRRD